MFSVDTTLTLQEVLLRLGVAMLVGATLGINRDLRDKPAGLRTLSLVTLGSSLLTIVSIEFAVMSQPMDVGALSRVAQGIITGIGFLGAGVILRGESPASVQGLTTAASIWLAACLGIACGAGQWVLALIALALTMFVLVLGGVVEEAIYRRVRGRTPGRD
jgi:putative Mg2+ transporter-C (MgtC) family protein